MERQITENKLNNWISKEDTLLIKGIAIFLMVSNHLFPIKEWIFPDNMYISLPIGKKTIASYFGGFGKICVAVFAFITGIGLYYTFRKSTSIDQIFKKNIKKIINFLISYWVILNSLDDFLTT